jgi:hypothetical protein
VAIPLTVQAVYLANLKVFLRDGGFRGVNQRNNVGFDGGIGSMGEALVLMGEA